MSDENGMLPEGWSLAPVADVVEHLRNGYVGPTRGIYQTKGIPYILSKHIRDNELTFDGGTFVTKEFNEKNRKSMLKAGDILLVQTGHVGHSAVVPPDHEGHNCHALIVISPVNDCIDGQFLSFQFAGPQIQRIFSGIEKGMTLRHLNCRDVIKVDVRVPPVPEQHRIVTKIESLQARSRKAREALAEVGPLLAQFRQSILAAAFSGRLTADWRKKNKDVEPASELLKKIRTERRQKWEEDQLTKYKAKDKKPPKNWQAKYKEPEPLQRDELEILQKQSLPKGWVWAPAELIVEPEAEIVYGIVQPGKKLDAGVPYVRGKDIVDGIILVDQLLNTSAKIAAKYERASLKGGDVLLGIIRATKVAIVPDILEGANITQGTARFRPSSIIRTNFLAGWLDSPSAQHWLHDHYRGIDMPGLNLRDVRRLPVPIAPLDEQETLESQIKRGIESVAKAMVQVAESESELSQLDQSILAKAFRGELVPQDPNDEPASELLNRIRQQREANSHTTKKKSRRHKR